jgi:hypothetical protein
MSVKLMRKICENRLEENILGGLQVDGSDLRLCAVSDSCCYWRSEERI